MTRGLFITVEGIEGAGKSTCMQLLTEMVEARGLSVVQTREPGGTSLGEALRALLLGHRHTGMGDDTELLLMFSARAEHIHQVIEPALAQGKWVICDRFTDATYAYQGYGRGLSAERIRILEEWVQGNLRPDLTLLMDLPVAQGLERAGKRSSPDRFEQEAHAFFERVRNGYLELARVAPDRFRVIDAAPDLAQVTHAIKRVVNEFLERRGV